MQEKAYTLHNRAKLLSMENLLESTSTIQSPKEEFFERIKSNFHPLNPIKFNNYLNELHSSKLKPTSQSMGVAIHDPTWKPAELLNQYMCTTIYYTRVHQFHLHSKLIFPNFWASIIANKQH